MGDAVHALLKETIIAHKRVIFNGNGYTDEWVKEAKKRGLYNLVSTPDALEHFTDDKNVELFVRHGVFTKEEIFSRDEILLENYSKSIHIEVKTLNDMLKKDFLPAVSAYVEQISETAVKKKTLVPGLPLTYETSLITKLSSLQAEIASGLEQLWADADAADAKESALLTAKAYHEVVLAHMEALRVKIDEAESLVPDALLPYPTYDQLLFSI